VELIESRAAGATARRHVLRFGTGADHRRRLFCLPYAGGTPAVYRAWSKLLPADVDVAAVALPGRTPGSAEPLLCSIDEIVAVLLPEVQAAATDLPYALFGHSMGALVAFELAVALEATAGPGPDCLFVSGRRAPDEPHRSSFIHDLPDDAFLDALDRSYGGVPDAVRLEPELLALLLPALRADVRTFETYAPLSDARVRCPVHVCGGADDTRPRPDQLRGWQRVADQEISVDLFPGGHFYLTAETVALTSDIAARWARDRAERRAG
jgi:medium-chain acyl-[acyl-carrier-protein] hydrolase